MVLLCMTPLAVQAIEEARKVAEDELLELQLPEPVAGEPISHSQLIDLSKLLRKHADDISVHGVDGDPPSYTLDSLLKGSRFYVPPPPPKKEPTPEYKALMARLRREEEARAYERMLNPRPAPETFAQRFAASPHAHQDPGDAEFDADDVSYQEVHRQIILIINVLVSIICCSVFIWIAARHWSAPKRLGLSMSGSGLVAVAEVVIYNGYVRKVKQAKMIEKKKPEIKEIIESWVIDGTSGKDTTSLSSVPKEKTEDGIRYRKGTHR